MVNYKIVKVGEKEHTVVCGVGAIIKLQKEFGGLVQMSDGLFPYKDKDGKTTEADIETTCRILKVLEEEAAESKEGLQTNSIEEIEEEVVKSQDWTLIALELWEIVNKSIAGDEEKKEQKKEKPAEK